MTPTPQGVIADLSKCEWCRTCADNCPSDAVEFVGQNVTVADVLGQIEKDVAFYDESGGGVTLSGGEPLMQPEFLLELLDACGGLDLHRTVDTTGYADAGLLLAVAEKTDLFLYDLKLMDPARHRKHTGVSNEKIMSNLKLLAQKDARIQVRIPIIPGINTDAANIDQTGEYVSALPGVEHISILPFHNSALGKYGRLGLECISPDIRMPTDEQLKDIAKRLNGFGLQVKIGG
jgi:pyruvate formate lyase activating enzyme